jgi:hypothetical protein
MGVLSGHTGLLFVSSAFDASNGTVGISRSDAPTDQRYQTTLRCERVHFAHGAGLCIAAERGVVTTFSASTFGPDFRVRNTFPLQGVPSRARVSPDGRRGAVTVFVSGDSYNSSNFSTRTTILDMANGRPIADLEQFTVLRDGAPFKAIDFNFWGVSFARDGNRFFATLRTGSSTYLIEANVDARSARILREGVECPSLSPDNKQIAFKKRVSASSWRLHLLRLDTLDDVPLGEMRSVDDQVEWLDDESIAYMLPSSESTGHGSDIWSLAIDGGQPRLLSAGASSPTALLASTEAPPRLTQQ